MLKRFVVEIETEGENEITRLVLWNALRSYFKNVNASPYVQITEINLPVPPADTLFPYAVKP